MTLTKQLLLSGMIVLLCLFAGMLTYVVRNTQSFLDQQLSSHAQDTATALGLSLTLTMKNNDVITANRIVDAVFDRGYYKTIEILSSNGAPLVERHLDVKVAGVPQFFIEALPIRTASKEAVIMDGWKKVGKVIIESNPGFAYQQIWLTFIESLKWLVMTGIIAVILGGILLYIILRPLRAITKQAAAICNQQFTIQESIPWTLDLRQVVVAMNLMSTRLKNMFDEQAQTSERLREQAYKDPVTHLGNRRYFDLQFDHVLNDEEKAGTGVLLLVELKDFKEYNDRFGYEAGDTLLKNVAMVISKVIASYENTISANKGASFFIVLPRKTKAAGEEVASAICQQLNEFDVKGLSQSKEVGNVGVTEFTTQMLKKDILARADMALRKAQSMGANVWATEQAEQPHVHGALEWGSIFDKAIRDNNIVLHFQEVQNWRTPHEKIYETLLRLPVGNNELITAGVFMPMAERLNQIMSLDKLVISNIVERIQQSNSTAIYSVNISASAFDDESFKKWLLERIKSLGRQANRLIIELPEYGVINRLETFREFFLKVAELGAKTSIDHYGKNFSSFSYLYNLKCHYLKIDGGFIRQIQNSEENQFFVKSLVDIAHSLDIAVMAESVETEAEYLMLQQLKVDGVQGYYVGKPTSITT
ncbi:MAG: EAL domain-containing protein [Candidatus Berkiella sp.]